MARRWTGARSPFLSLARRVIALLAAKAASEAVIAAVSVVATAADTAAADINSELFDRDSPRL